MFAALFIFKNNCFWNIYRSIVIMQYYHSLNHLPQKKNISRNFDGEKQKNLSLSPPSPEGLFFKKWKNWCIEKIICVRDLLVNCWKRGEEDSPFLFDKFTLAIHLKNLLKQKFIKQCFYRIFCFNILLVTITPCIEKISL